MNYATILRLITTFGPLGHAKASGTLASLVSFPVAFLLRKYMSWSSYGILVCVVTISSFFCIQKALCFFEHDDPHEIVIDESIGCFIAVFLLPLKYGAVIGSFILFRFFDISKCFGIRKCEEFAGAYGILLDDMVAGLLANVIMQIVYR